MEKASPLVDRASLGERSHAPEEAKLARRLSRRQSLFAPHLLRAALKRSIIMLRPDILWKNPVMFTVEVGTVLSTIATIRAMLGWGGPPVTYLLALDIWLLLTVLFANFAEALAEARGKAQTEALRKTRKKTPAYRLHENGQVEETDSTALRAGDRVVVVEGQVIPGDGEIIEGVASVDESAITGESAPVIREAGGDRSGVTGGTRVLSDRIIVEVTAEPGHSFLDRMIALVEGGLCGEEGKICCQGRKPGQDSEEQKWGKLAAQQERGGLHLRAMTVATTAARKRRTSLTMSLPLSWGFMGEAAPSKPIPGPLTRNGEREIRTSSRRLSASMLFLRPATRWRHCL